MKILDFSEDFLTKNKNKIFLMDSLNTIYLLCTESIHGDIYKIGFTKYSNPNKRIKQLKTGNPDIFLIDYFNTTNKRKIETILHNLYKHKLINGEWFELTEEEVVGFSSLCGKIENNLNLLKENNNNFL